VQRWLLTGSIESATVRQHVAPYPLKSRQRIFE
jgi:hypothetical protein